MRLKICVTIWFHLLISYSLRWQLFPIYQMFPCYYDSTEPRCILVAKSQQRRHNTKTQIVSKTLCLHNCIFLTQLHLLAQNIPAVVPILNDKIPTKLLTQSIKMNILQTFIKLCIFKINSCPFFPPSFPLLAQLDWANTASLFNSRVVIQGYRYSSLSWIYKSSHVPLSH